MNVSDTGKSRTWDAGMEGTDYSLDYVVTRLGWLTSILHQGSRDEKKRALGLLLQRIWVDLEGNVKEVVLQGWAQPLFVDLSATLGDQVRPKGPRAHTMSPLLRG